MTSTTQNVMTDVQIGESYSSAASGTRLTPALLAAGEITVINADTNLVVDDTSVLTAERIQIAQYTKQPMGGSRNPGQSASRLSMVIERKQIRRLNITPYASWQPRAFHLQFNQVTGLATTPAEIVLELIINTGKDPNAGSYAAYYQRRMQIVVPAGLTQSQVHNLIANKINAQTLNPQGQIMGYNLTAATNTVSFLDVSNPAYTAAYGTITRSNSNSAAITNDSQGVLITTYGAIVDIQFGLGMSAGFVTTGSTPDFIKYAGYLSTGTSGAPLEAVGFFGNGTYNVVSNEEKTNIADKAVRNITYHPRTDAVFYAKDTVYGQTDAALVGPPPSVFNAGDGYDCYLIEIENAVSGGTVGNVTKNTARILIYLRNAEADITDNLLYKILTAWTAPQTWDASMIGTPENDYVR